MMLLMQFIMRGREFLSRKIGWQKSCVTMDGRLIDCFYLSYVCQVELDSLDFRISAIDGLADWKFDRRVCFLFVCNSTALPLWFVGKLFFIPALLFDWKSASDRVFGRHEFWRMHALCVVCVHIDDEIAIIGSFTNPPALNRTWVFWIFDITLLLPLE